MSRAQARGDGGVDVVVGHLKNNEQLGAAILAARFDKDQVSSLLTRLAMLPRGTLRTFFDVLKTTNRQLAWTLSGRNVTYELRTGFIRAAQHHAYSDHVELGTFMVAQIQACRKMQPLPSEESEASDYHVLRWLDAWLPMDNSHETLWDVATSHLLCGIADVCAFFYKPVAMPQIVCAIFNAALRYAQILAVDEDRVDRDAMNEVFRLASCGLFLCGKDQEKHLHEPDVILLPQSMPPSILASANVFRTRRGNQRAAERAFRYCQALYDGHMAFLNAAKPPNTTLLQWKSWRLEYGLGTEIDAELEKVVMRERGRSQFES